MPHGKVKISWIPALYITLVYLVTGIIWIMVSDRLSLWFSYDEKSLLVFQTYKGMVYVFATALLLFFFIYKQIKKRNSLILLLSSRNRLLSLVLEKQPDVNVFLVDKKGVIAQSFGKGSFLKGVSDDYLVGKNISEFVDNINNEYASNYIKDVWEGKTTRNEVKINNSWYEIKGSLISKGSSNLSYALFIVENINNRKILLDEHARLTDKCESLSVNLSKYESDIDFEQQKFSHVFNMVNDGLIIQNISNSGSISKVESINRSAMVFLGLENNNLEPSILWRNLNFNRDNSLEMLLNNNFRERNSLSLFASALVNNELFEYEISSRFVFLDKNPLVISIVRNVSDSVNLFKLNRKDSFDALAILNSLTNAAMLVNVELQCVFANHKCEQLFNSNLASFVSKQVAHIFVKAISFDIASYMEEVVNGRAVQSVDFQFEGLGGKWFSCDLYPVQNSNNEVSSVLIIIQDVTDRRETEEKVYLHQNAVEESGRMKSTFLSNLSHEVRTPMNGILGFVELLEQDDMNEHQLYYLELIRKSSENLLMILEALINVADIENGQIVPDNQWVDTTILLSHISNYTKDKLANVSKSNINLNIISSEKLPSRIYIDENHVKNLMELLIDNAVKYTINGSIEIGVEETLKGDLSLWVKDTGIGINMMYLNSIFLPFTTYNNNENVLYGGIGLGLAIVKGLVKILGGNIEVESKQGFGSKFIVTIPLRLHAISDGDNYMGESVLRVNKVLIIQYGHDTLKTITEHLKHYNVTILHAPDGAMAIEMFFENKDIDIVFCDIRLSDMDGFELLKTLKRIKPNVPVIAQSVFFIAEEKRRCLNEGFDDYLVKPIDKSMLFKVLKSY